MDVSRKFEQVVYVVSPPSRLLRAWPLKGGLSADMMALEIEEPDGRKRKLILRRHNLAHLAKDPQATEKEFRLLQITNKLGLATPEAYYFDQSGKIFARPYMLIEYVEGEMDFSPADLASCIRQLATHLARIHSIDGSGVDLSFLSESNGGCVELTKSRPMNVDPSLEEARIREALASIPPLAQRNASTLLHGDYWPGNTLWQDDKLAAVIDWEDASLGDPLIDLAISRLDIAWIFGIEAMNTFTTHYQSLMVLDYTNLPYWDLCAALRLVCLAGSDLAGWVAYFRPFGRDDITVQSLKEDYLYFVNQAFGNLIGIG